LYLEADKKNKQIKILLFDFSNFNSNLDDNYYDDIEPNYEELKNDFLKNNFSDKRF
jgi:hypothetical protein